MKPFIIKLLFVCLLSSAVYGKDLRDVIGISHMAGRYTFQGWPVTDGTKRDYLNEGADAVLATGSRVIRVGLHPVGVWYYYTANPGYDNSIFAYPPEQRLVETVKQQRWQDLFNKPFTTYVLMVMSNVAHPARDQSGNIIPGEDYTKYGLYDSMFDENLLTAAEATQEKNAVKNLAAYLLSKSQWAGKTFIITSIEGDHILRSGLLEGSEAPQSRVQPMIAWTNARQNGVNEARAANPSSLVKVFNAAEVNRVLDAYNGIGVTMTNQVIPSTQCDLYSYTYWDLGPTHDPDLFHRALYYLALKAPDTPPFQNKNIYVGEYGSAENADHPTGYSWPSHYDILKRNTEVALGFGVQYLIFWAIYDNEPCRNTNDPPPCQYNQSLWTDPDGSGPLTASDVPVTNNSWMRGLWLIRPDGTKPPIYTYLQDLMTKSIHYAAFRAANPYYVCADEDQARRVVVNRPSAQKWETFAIIDPTGGDLIHGETVNLLSHTGFFVAAENNGGGAVNANRTAAAAWETFTIQKVGGTGTINAGDAISFRTGAGYFFATEGGGGSGSVLNADRLTVGPWETFVYTPQTNW